MKTNNMNDPGKTIKSVAARRSGEYNETVSYIAIYRICDKCNKEFVVRGGVELAEKPTGLSHNIMFENCSHCGEQNSILIRIVRHI